MKRKYEDVVKGRIAKLKSEIDKYIDRLGAERLTEILIDKFALSDKKASNFLGLINELTPNISYGAIPEDWFFEPGVQQRGKFWYVIEKDDDKHRIVRRCNSLKELAPEIREERDEIRNTIQLFWKLPDKEKNIVIELWPKEYQDYLRKKPHDIGSEEYILPENEQKIYSATEIADIVVSKRYDSEKETIKSYAKLGKASNK